VDKNPSSYQVTETRWHKASLLHRAHRVLSPQSELLAVGRHDGLAIDLKACESLASFFPAVDGKPCEFAVCLCLVQVMVCYRRMLAGHECQVSMRSNQLPVDRYMNSNSYKCCAACCLSPTALTQLTACRESGLSWPWLETLLLRLYEGQGGAAEPRPERGQLRQHRVTEVPWCNDTRPYAAPRTSNAAHHRQFASHVLLSAFVGLLITYRRQCMSAALDLDYGDCFRHHGLIDHLQYIILFSFHKVTCMTPPPNTFRGVMCQSRTPCVGLLTKFACRA
jgi:hypothetical protein